VSDIFREEALAELRGRGGPGDVLRAGPRWLVWSFAALLVLVAVGAAAAVTIHIPEHARGPAVADGRLVTAVLPLAFRGEVRPGSTIRFDFHGVRRSGQVATVELTPDGLVARTPLARPLAGRAPRAGRASVRVGSETLFDLLRG
jgi:hypothetical protein